MARLGLLLALAVVLTWSSAAAAEARPAKLTAPESRWAAAQVNLMKSLSGRVGAIRGIVADPAVLVEGAAARRRLQATLRELVLCGDRLRRNGAPPTARLRPFHTALKGACTSYARGAVELTAGVAKADAGLITSSLGRFRNGSKLLALAQRRLVALAA